MKIKVVVVQLLIDQRQAVGRHGIKAAVDTRARQSLLEIVGRLTITPLRINLHSIYILVIRRTGLKHHQKRITIGALQAAVNRSIHIVVGIFGPFAVSPLTGNEIIRTQLRRQPGRIDTLQNIDRLTEIAGRGKHEAAVNLALKQVMTASHLTGQLGLQVNVFHGRIKSVSMIFLINLVGNEQFAPHVVGSMQSLHPMGYAPLLLLREVGPQPYGVVKRTEYVIPTPRRPHSRHACPQTQNHI